MNSTQIGKLSDLVDKLYDMMDWVHYYRLYNLIVDLPKDLPCRKRLDVFLTCNDNGYRLNEYGTIIENNIKAGIGLIISKLINKIIEIDPEFKWEMSNDDICTMRIILKSMDVTSNSKILLDSVRKVYKEFEYEDE